MSIVEQLNDGKAGIEWIEDSLVSAVVTASDGHQNIIYQDSDWATVQYIQQQDKRLRKIETEAKKLRALLFRTAAEVSYLLREDDVEGNDRLERKVQGIISCIRAGIEEAQEDEE